MTAPRTRRTGTAIVAATALLCTACGGGGTEATDDPNQPITLTVATFGEFGYAPLFADYQKAHPNITIKSRVADFDTHHKTLATQLAAGRGAADVEAVEEQYFPQFRQSKDKFVNLADYGAKSLQNRYTSWKWDQGVTDDGGFVMGLGTDMGGLAMCYNKDVIAKAGLPTDRVALGNLWPTWEAFEQVADRFSADLATKGYKFADSSGSIDTAILNQADENFFARADDSFIGDKNPNVKRAFDIAGTIGAKGETAQISPYTQPWSVAIKQGSFATLTCPAWELEQIRTAAGPENAGKWDVTTVPGRSGSQGGSFLSIPKQSAHPRQAYDLAAWLTAPSQEKRLFLEDGILPSEPSAYQDPQVLDKTDAYFGNAPIGQLYAASADSLRPTYRGTQDAKVRPVFGQALSRVEEGKESLAAGWADAVSQARDALH